MQLPLIDDARSIQNAISTVLNSLAAGTLDATRARAMLYGLQIAAVNARRLAAQPSEKPANAASNLSDRSEQMPSESPSLDDGVVAVDSADVTSQQSDIVLAEQPQDSAAFSTPHQPSTKAEPVATIPYEAEEAPLIAATQHETAMQTPRSSVDALHPVRCYNGSGHQRIMAHRQRRLLSTS